MSGAKSPFPALLIFIYIADKISFMIFYLYLEFFLRINGIANNTSDLAQYKSTKKQNYSNSSLLGHQFKLLNAKVSNYQTTTAIHNAKKRTVKQNLINKLKIMNNEKMINIARRK